MRVIGNSWCTADQGERAENSRWAAGWPVQNTNFTKFDRRCQGEAGAGQGETALLTSILFLWVLAGMAMVVACFSSYPAPLESFEGLSCFLPDSFLLLFDFSSLSCYFNPVEDRFVF
jgi:hypothetical protein